MKTPYPELRRDVTRLAAELATCPVTTWDKRPRRNRATQPCGQPVERYGLCAQHAADKERLS